MARCVFYLNRKMAGSFSSNSLQEETGTSGFLIFDPNLSMRYFNIDTIHNLGEIEITEIWDSSVDSEDLELIIQSFAMDAEVWKAKGNSTRYETLKGLFWLGSIVDDRFIQGCMDLIDKIDPKLKLNVNDIILVFLNWGASLKILRVEHIMPNSKLNIPLGTKPNFEISQGVLNNGCFSGRSLAAVLAIISQRLPIESEDWELHSKILLMALTTASLEPKHCSSRLLFTNVINVILESYSEWNAEKAQQLAEVLDVGPSHVNEVACCLLVGTGTRIQQLSKCVAYKFIKSVARSSTSSNYFLKTLSHAAVVIDPAAHMINTHSYEKLISLIDLYLYLIEDYVHKCKMNPAKNEEEKKSRSLPIGAIHEWSLDARVILKQDPHKFVMQANQLYRQANRLTSYTANLLQHMFHTRSILESMDDISDDL